MSIPDQNAFNKHLHEVVEEENFIDQMKITYGVPRYVTRKLVMQHGISEAVYKALELAGYPIRKNLK